MTPPEVLLKAARKVCPGDSWVISKSTGLPFNGAGYFDIEDGDDRMALQEALEKEGWVFYQLDDLFGASKGAFSAFFDEVQLSNTVHAPTKPDLLLAIVREGV